MRKILLCMAVLAGAATVSPIANAAPAFAPVVAPLASAMPTLDRAPIQTVQYHRDWRARRYWRHRRHEEWRRRQAYRHHGYVRPRAGYR